MLSNKPLLALVLAFLTITKAHVEIETPVPYGAGDSAPGLDTNPLLKDGSDFPCKQRPDVYKVVKNNVMAIGQLQTLSFRGQATHGGGSCQISLSTDKQPTKDSVWKVILSIQGGCPSKNPGNVGEDPFGYGADKFQYSIPPQIAPGDYTLAFTWFNKIGEREMYMNCAPITVQSSSEKRDLVNNNGTISEMMSDDDGEVFDKRDMSSLPDMFVANIGNGCTTGESGTDLEFPAENLGEIIQRVDTGPLTPPVGNCVKKSGGSTPKPAVPSAPQPPPAPTTPAKPEPTTPVQPEPPIDSPAAPLPLPHTIGTTTGTCPTPGKSLCSDDGLGFGTCDQNHVVLFQPLPPGTKCDGELGVMVPARRLRGRGRG